MIFAAFNKPETRLVAFGEFNAWFWSGFSLVCALVRRLRRPNSLVRYVSAEVETHFAWLPALLVSLTLCTTISSFHSHWRFAVSRLTNWARHHLSACRSFQLHLRSAPATAQLIPASLRHRSGLHCLSCLLNSHTAARGAETFIVPSCCGRGQSFAFIAWSAASCSSYILRALPSRMVLTFAAFTHHPYICGTAGALYMATRRSEEKLHSTSWD